MTCQDCRRANRAFLDASIARGQQFYMTHPVLGAEGFYAMELQYLISRGIGPDKWVMLPSRVGVGAPFLPPGFIF